jgi:ribosomal protein S4
LDDTKSLSLFARREGGLSRDSRDAARDRDQTTDNGDEVPPVASLMFTDVERRVDVLVFRACFAHSVYEARRMIIHGDVKLNGKKVRITQSLISLQPHHTPSLPYKCPPAPPHD